MIREEWKSVPDFEGSYEVSNFGRARSLDRTSVSINKKGLITRKRLKGKEMKVRKPTKTLAYHSVSFRKPKIQKTFTLHRLVGMLFLSNWSKDLEVDHVDGNINNNIVSNLRMATSQQQKFNSKTKKNTSSRFKGVGWDKKKHKWRSRIVVNNREKHISYFDSEIEAALEYERLAKIEHKEFFKKDKELQKMAGGML